MEPNDAQKLQVIYSRVSPDIFPLIRDTPTYSEAMELLKRHCVRPVNQLYTRHFLSMRQQVPGESLDDLWHALHTLARNCDCQAVSAVQHTEFLIRDAFVTGMGSAYVRQNLLEGGTLDLEDPTLKFAIPLNRTISNLNPLLNAVSTQEYSLYRDVL